MEVRLLGPLEVLVDGRPVVVGAGKRRSLLALLALHPNEVLPAERLIDELWDGQPPSTAAKGLQVQVSQLRKDLRVAADGTADDGILKTRGHGYVVELAPEAVDVHRFEAALEAGRHALESGDAAAASELLRAALAMWRGPPLADFAYEAFARQPIARLDELRLVALERRVEADLQLGRHADVAGELMALVGEHPLRERLRAQLMLALYRCGRQADALEVYRSGRTHLIEELGLEPGPELRRLEQQILEQSPDLDAPPSADPTPPAAPPATRRPALLAAAVIVVVAAAVSAVLLGGDDEPTARAAISLDSASNSLVRLDADGVPDAAVPLPGRTFDLAAGVRTIWAVTVGSDTISAIDVRAGAIQRTVPLRFRPEAVAVGAQGVWVAGDRVLARLPTGYQDVGEPIRYRPGASSAPPRGARALTPRVSLAVAEGRVWLADGSRSLVRVDERTSASDRVGVGIRATAVAAGAGALWAVGAEDAAVVRIDPGTGAVTGRVALVGRRIGRDPFPATIAATRSDVWVLNGNTATLTRLDPRSVGVVATVKLGLDRVPSGLAADDKAAWVANGDGSVSRVDASSNAVRSIWIGRALRDIVMAGPRPWVVTTAVGA